MLKTGFLRFCDNPEIACCKAEKELERLRNEDVTLKAQLAESQRRERAAVEDMEHIASEIEECDWILAKGGELVGSLHLGRCAVCSHKYCDEEIDGGCKFEWRGPGAGEGDNNGAE